MHLDSPARVNQFRQLGAFHSLPNRFRVISTELGRNIWRVVFLGDAEADLIVFLSIKMKLSCPLNGEVLALLQTAAMIANPAVSR